MGRRMNISLPKLPDGWEDEERCWGYLVKHQLATAEEVAKACDVTPEFAQRLIDRISTPKEVRMEAQEQEAGGFKHDTGKVRMDLLPPELLHEVALVLTHAAATKYPERNWEGGMKWGRPFAALMRHMWAWWGGEDKDSETGFSHLAHAACCLTFLIAYEKRGIGTDDRPSQGGF